MICSCGGKVSSLSNLQATLQTSGDSMPIGIHFLRQSKQSVPQKNYWRVGFMAPNRDDLVDKPHLKIVAKNLGQRVQLIHEWYNTKHTKCGWLQEEEKTKITTTTNKIINRKVCIKLYSIISFTLSQYLKMAITRWINVAGWNNFVLCFVKKFFCFIYKFLQISFNQQEHEC